VALLGGQVIDPSAGVDAPLDLLLEAGRIVALGERVSVPRGASVVDCRGLSVTPGLIDLHTHVCTVTMRESVDPDVAGVRSGVTTVVDAGSTGGETLPTFLDQAENTQTGVEIFLNIARTGLSSHPEIVVADDASVDVALAAADRWKDRLSGIKVRVEESSANALGIKLVTMAKEIAAAVRLPTMVHLGANPSAPNARLCEQIAPGILELLDAGDIVTHAMTGRPGGLIADERVLDQARDAYARGVYFDVAHGFGNLAFQAADTLIAQGLVPHTVSTDKTTWSPACSLTDVMSKFMLLGFSFPDVVRMATQAPAEVLRRRDLGHLRVGEIADVSVLKRSEGRWRFTDCAGEERVGKEGIIPVAVVRQGRLLWAGDGPYETGWLPATAD
jgi:dihydroorotase